MTKGGSAQTSEMLSDRCKSHDFHILKMCTESRPNINSTGKTDCYQTKKFGYTGRPRSVSGRWVGVLDNSPWKFVSHTGRQGVIHITWREWDTSPFFLFPSWFHPWSISPANKQPWTKSRLLREVSCTGHESKTMCDHLVVSQSSVRSPIPRYTVQRHYFVVNNLPHYLW